MPQTKPIQKQAAYQVNKQDTLSCPLPGHDQWSSHPRIYLPIAKTGRTVCPYCGTEYYWEGCEDAPITEVYR